MEKIANEILKRAGLDPDGLLKEFNSSLTTEQAAWLAGYFAGAAETNRQLAAVFARLGTPAVAVDAKSFAGGCNELLILVASHSGNGKSIAKKLAVDAENAGFKVRNQNLAVYKPGDIKNEKDVLIIISTHGEGVPPASAEEFFEYLRGSRAPRLEGMRYSVLALGDKSYVNYCQAGVDLDNVLSALGAQRLLARVDCDVDFSESAESWTRDVLSAFRAVKPAAATASSGAVQSGAPVSVGYSARDPFQALVLTKENLNGKGSEKETYHIELSLEGAGISYQPGDACGLVPQNSDSLVSELLAELRLSGSELTGDGSSLIQVLKSYELSVLTVDVIKRHNSFAASKVLNDLLFDVSRLKEFIYGRDIIDLFKEFPVAYKPLDLLTVLRPIPPRLYSIASSPLAHPGKMNLLVGAVRYNTFGRRKEGVASTFWADRVVVGQKVPVFVKSHETFRLPLDGTLPLIMVGPGTGVAPFRAFVEERAARGDTGRNWLFFGNQHAATDFLYQKEWQEHLASGRLTRLDTAFSRDQESRVYVQHKIQANAREIFSWLKDGACVYVCGDMKRMAQDVYHTFIEVVSKEGGIPLEKAVDYVRALKRSGRYLEDVY